MKQLKIWSLIFLLLGTVSLLSAETKRYEVESGIIEYAITQSGNMMGMSMSGKGTAKTVFKKWGSVELHTEKTESVTMGMKEREEDMTKIENGKVFVVDFDDKVIYEYTPELLANSEHKELLASGKEIFASMGGKKIGEEAFMGYDCEVWELMHVKVWIHKGVMLKSEANMMGVKHTTVATKITFDTSVSDKDLQLPDFPVRKADQKGGSHGEGFDGGMPQLTPEQMQQMQEMMRSFSSK